MCPPDTNFILFYDQSFTSPAVTAHYHQHCVQSADKRERIRIHTRQFCIPFLPFHSALISNWINIPQFNFFCVCICVSYLHEPRKLICTAPEQRLPASNESVRERFCHKRVAFIGNQSMAWLSSAIRGFSKATIPMEREHHLQPALSSCAVCAFVSQSKLDHSQMVLACF